MPKKKLETNAEDVQTTTEGVRILTNYDYDLRMGLIVEPLMNKYDPRGQPRSENQNAN